MRSWRVVRLAVLLVLLGVLAWTLIARGPSGRLGTTKVAALETPFKTELEWAVQQTSSDLEEMAAFAAKRSPSLPPKRDPSLVAWDPDTFTPAVTRLMPGVTSDAAAPSQSALPEIYLSLTAMTVPAIVNASAAVSKALAEDMRNPRAHEAAALVVGAFALREAADWFHDPRWALNRMTAHLAAAAALRGEQAPGPDGLLARVTLLTLANRQAQALGLLDTLGEGSPPNELTAWVRALRLRITQDWRALPEPASATRLEKLEYFRARRSTVQRRLAGEELAALGEEPAADFARIAQHYQLGVVDGHIFIDPARGLELAEAAEAHRLVRKQPMPHEYHEALNERASRLLSPAPEVLPWGAWAEFYQRHLAMNISNVDMFHRRQLGSAVDADDLKQQLEDELGKLTSFPLGTAMWTKGQAGTEADLRFIREVTALTARAPEIVAFKAWAFFEIGSRFEPVPELMPKAAQWFATPTPQVPYEAGLRITEGRRLAGAALEEIVSVAATDRTLLAFAAASKPGSSPAAIKGLNLLRPRFDYDLKALDLALSELTDDADRAELQRKGCELAARDCAALGWTLTRLGDEAGAVAAFERAFADPAIDPLALSQDAGWLVNYYVRERKDAKALELAERAASSGSGAGVIIQAHLFEQFGRLDEAERNYLHVKERYNDPTQLIGFYYRQFVVNGVAAYSEKWKVRLAETFPKGLVPVPTSMPTAPKSGVFVYKDNARSTKAGLRAGDIIVGLEGYRVDNVLQYHAINAFTGDDRMKITIWRGKLVSVETVQPGRLFGIYLETHPMKGWIR